MNYRIAALYRFVPLTDLPQLRTTLLAEFSAMGLCGTLLIAPEGINGTLAGSAAAIDCLIDALHVRFGLAKGAVKFSEADEKPFNRLKVRIKKEIITFNQTQADPNKLAGTYVTAQDWNRLLDDPDVVVLDTRNKYETLIGSFAGARDPQIEAFTEFADYVRTQLDLARDKKIAMFCTGGIRCEKASAFMRAAGFEEVYHLQGGILKYLEEVQPQHSKWNGECYVFDRRMAVGHGLTTGRYSMCFCCGYPLAAADKAHELYEDGVSCGYCHGETSDADKARYRMRHQQMTASAD